MTHRSLRSLPVAMMTAVLTASWAGAADPRCHGLEAAPVETPGRTAGARWQSAIAHRHHHDPKSTYCGDLLVARKAQQLLVEQHEACRRTASLFASERLLEKMAQAARRWRCDTGDDDDDDDDDGE